MNLLKMVNSKPRSSEGSHKNPESKPTKTKTTVSLVVDSKSCKSLIERKPSIKGKKSSSEKRTVKGLEMQEQFYDLQDDLKKTKEQLAVVEEEKNRAIDELGEMKKVSEAATLKLSEALSSQAQANEVPVVEISRVTELEQVSIISAQKRDEAWQLEIEAVQKQHGLDVEELNHIRNELVSALEAKDEALKTAEEARHIAQANAKNVMDLSAEVNLLKEALDDSNEDLEIKDKSIDRLKAELGKAREIEASLVHKEASLQKLQQVVAVLRESESVSKQRSETLKVEAEKAKELENKMLESLNSQTKQLEETKILLEEANLEVTNLQEKVDSLEDLIGHTSRDLDTSQDSLKKVQVEKKSMEGELEALKSELEAAKDILARSKTDGGFAPELACGLAQEISLLRAELKKATEAEEKSRKAMDDLALVVIEVSKENKELKEKLSSTQSALDSVREESEGLKQMLRSTEDKYQGLLDETREELDRVKDEAERLKIEADDSIVSWNLKELEFVNCIKRAEEECSTSKQEYNKLVESLKGADNMFKMAREENCKLRDILKQAINEASVAKEAAQIAREENNNLKDNIEEKDSMLETLIQDNENLRINEAAALENIKELKRMLSTTTSSTDTRTDDSNVEGEDDKKNHLEEGEEIDSHIGEAEKKNDHPGETLKKQNTKLKDHNFSRRLSEVFTMKLEEVKIPHSHKDEEEEDTEKIEISEMLKGSIFDVVDSPVAPLPVTSHHRKASSSAFTDDGETINLEDLEHLDGIDDLDNDKSSQRKKRALLRRFGDLIKKTSSFHRRDPSLG